MNNKPKIIVFSSGTKDGGGSGFENLVIKSRGGSSLNYETVAVVSNYENGGVRERADKLGIPFGGSGVYGIHVHEAVIKASTSDCSYNALCYRYGSKR